MIFRGGVCWPGREPHQRKSQFQEPTIQHSCKDEQEKVTHLHLLALTVTKKGC